MNLFSRSIRFTIKLVMLTLLGFQSMTLAIASVRDGEFTCRTPVSEAVLDSMRGGFQRDPDGPFMSFGIERNVFDNERLVSSTVLRIPDMTRLADHHGMKRFGENWNLKLFADQSDIRPSVNHPNDTFTIIQSGPGNSWPSDMSALPPLMTVIQNSLDNQTIHTETVINVTVEALTWARSLERGNALSLANVEAIRH